MGFDLQTYLRELEYLVNIDSPTNDPQGVERISDYFYQKYTELGLSAKKTYFGNSVGMCLEIANTDQKHTDCLLLGHMDTAFPKGTAGLRPYKEEKGIAYGPGVADMKSGLLSMYCLVKRLVEEKSGISFRVILNSHQESGSSLAKDWITQMGSRSDVCYVFHSAREDGSLVRERSGNARIMLKFEGVLSHAGDSPLEGRSAIHEMSQFITEIVPLSNYDNGTAVNVGMVSGGTGANNVAKNASCEVDIRFKALEEYLRIKSRITELAHQSSQREVTAKIEESGFCPPLLCGEKTERIMRLLEEQGKKQGIAVSWQETGSTSDGNFVSSCGTPVIDGCGPVGGGGHSESEFLRTDTVEPRINLIYATILCAAKKDSDEH